MKDLERQYEVTDKDLDTFFDYIHRRITLAEVGRRTMNKFEQATMNQTFYARRFIHKVLKWGFIQKRITIKRV